MRNRSMQLPPGPSTFPIQQTIEFAAAPYDYLARCHREFGDYFTLRFAGQPPHVYIADPEAVRWVFSRPRDVFRNQNEIAGLALGDRSVLFMDGEEHRRERQMLMPAFHGERMRLYGETMREATEAGLAQLASGTPVSIHEELQRVTLRVITRCVFGVAEGPDLDRLQALLAKFLESTLTPFLFVAAVIFKAHRMRKFIQERGDLDVRASRLGRVKALLPWQALANQRVEIDRLLLAEITRCRREGPEARDDILSMIMSVRDERGHGLSDLELRDELLTLLVAGHETTATTASWAVQHIIRTPRAHQRLVAELDEAFPDGRVRPERVGQLNYLKAVVNETLRLSPIAVAVVRELTGPAKIGPYELDAGTVLLPSVFLAHRSPASWERPADFEPERFLAGEPSPFKFFPFGGGVRRCVGSEFARYQLRIVLAQLFRSADIEPAVGTAPQPRMRGAVVGLSEVPVRVRARRRPGEAIIPPSPEVRA
jgi:cytochrome P450